jgi:hypothetical protein
MIYLLDGARSSLDLLVIKEWTQITKEYPSSNEGRKYWVQLYEIKNRLCIAPGGQLNWQVP